MLPMYKLTIFLTNLKFQFGLCTFPDALTCQVMAVIHNEF